MKQSLKDKAYDHIKEKIVSCEYIPGDFLDEKVLISEIGASRTPIREALNKLEQENLIQILPKKGVLVTQISYKDVVDTYELRLFIEPQLIIALGDKINADVIKGYIEESKTIKNIEQMDNHDDNVHNYFTSLYGNQYINDMFATVRSQNNRIRIMTSRESDGRFDHTIAEHNAIFNAILEKDYLLAAEKYKEHLILSKERTLHILLKFN